MGEPQVNTCAHCGWSWVQRTLGRPKKCPNIACQKPNWDKPTELVGKESK